MFWYRWRKECRTKSSHSTSSSFKTKNGWKFNKATLLQQRSRTESHVELTECKKHVSPVMYRCRCVLHLLILTDWVSSGPDWFCDWGQGKMCYIKNWNCLLYYIQYTSFGLPGSRIMYLTFCDICHFFCWGWSRRPPCSLLFLSPPLDLLLLKLKNLNSKSKLSTSLVSEGKSMATLRNEYQKATLATFQIHEDLALLL